MQKHTYGYEAFLSLFLEVDVNEETVLHINLIVTSQN